MSNITVVLGENPLFMQMCESQPFLPSELHDNAHLFFFFPPHYIIQRFDWSAGGVRERTCEYV